MTRRPTPDDGIQCACCDSRAMARVRWFVTGPGWQERDLCEVHARQVHEATAGAVARLHAPPVTYGPAGQPIFDPVVVAKSRASHRDDAAAMRGL